MLTGVFLEQSSAQAHHRLHYRIPLAAAGPSLGAWGGGGGTVPPTVHTEPRGDQPPRGSPRGHPPLQHCGTHPPSPQNPAGEGVPLAPPTKPVSAHREIRGHGVSPWQGALGEPQWPGAEARGGAVKEIGKDSRFSLSGANFGNRTLPSQTAFQRMGLQTPFRA